MLVAAELVVVAVVAAAVANGAADGESLLVAAGCENWKRHCLASALEYLADSENFALIFQPPYFAQFC